MVETWGDQLRREELIEIYGEDEWPNGTVLRFYKLFKEEGTLYTYVAVKNGNSWYIGGAAGPKAWWVLLDTFESENLLEAEAIYVATDYDRVYDVEGEDYDESKLVRVVD